jgi:hypothetical protein
LLLLSRCLVEARSIAPAGGVHARRFSEAYSRSSRQLSRPGDAAPAHCATRRKRHEGSALTVLPALSPRAQ